MASMIVGLCRLELQFPGSASLKDKRRVLQSLMSRLRNAYNVSVSEVDHLDAWQRATVGVACVSSSGAYARGLLDKVVEEVEGAPLDLVLLDHEIELL